MRSGRVTVPLADVEHIDVAELFSLSGGQRDAVRAARPRLLLFAVVFALGYAVLMARSVGLTLFAHRPVAVRSHNPVMAVLPPRARMTDRNGALLASSIETYSAYIERAYIRDPAKLAARLSRIRGMADEAALRRRLQGGRGRASLGHRLTPRIRDALFALGLPGLSFVPEQTRYYPRRSFAAHLLGWVNADGHGASGAERAFDARLLNERAAPLALSIDTRIQFALQSELRAAMDDFHPLAALGIVTRVKTGEVLALAGLPSFDPNAPGKASPNERRNRAATDRYELGSVFKPLTLAMAFDQGLTGPDDVYDVVSPLVVDGRTIRDMHRHRHKLSTRDILVQSSNKGAALIALKLGGALQQRYLEAFGLLDAARIELRESARPYMASRVWRPVKTATIGFGHGITVTPLAFVQAMGALANHGRLVPLTVLARPPGYQPPARQVVSPQSASMVLRLMREVVTRGTGRRADVPGYEVAGKTGSAEKLDRKTGTYAKDRNVTSFAAIFPASDPQYLVFILLDEPRGDRQTSGWETAGWNAAPVAGRVISRIGPVLLPGFARSNRLASIREAEQ